MKIIVCENYAEMSARAAELIAELVKAKPDCVLGLATGSTPVGMYKELISKNEAGEISFKDVTTYNLDEYYPIEPTHEQSYRYFMNVNLFDHIDINKEKTFVPNGLTQNPEEEGAAYDAAIEAAGGVDLQVLGIGQNGHIAFNEPDDALIAGTHITSLTEDTIDANSRFFASRDDVPTRAFTMGIGSIMKAKKIILLANGKNKHAAIAKMLDDKITTQCPATILKAHADVYLFCDKDAYNG
ncbi:MAG: glucosamine-6-phosphate deaminase [Ruminococcaceae bacterium]|nr:glucosamine-6-phosphate deaminase [Oscillospiraceae bacterium]